MSLPRLTLRKLSILLHLEAGRSYKQIAADLSIHEKTVVAHVRAIAEALPASQLCARDLVLLWCERLLVEHAEDIAQLRRAA